MNKLTLAIALLLINSFSFCNINNTIRDLQHSINQLERISSNLKFVSSDNSWLFQGFQCDLDREISNCRSITRDLEHEIDKITKK